MECHRIKGIMLIDVINVKIKQLSGQLTLFDLGFF